MPIFDVGAVFSKKGEEKILVGTKICGIRGDRQIILCPVTGIGEGIQGAHGIHLPYFDYQYALKFPAPQNNLNFAITKYLPPHATTLSTLIPAVILDRAIALKQYLYTIALALYFLHQSWSYQGVIGEIYRQNVREIRGKIISKKSK
ncbi:hypothetical protein [[Limnothrix rosea] IAM M-220]|uniref:hypothetical protein n=1 Tax=[Limnothrix rosea] IAM M-220 TaxID=454133 RepID=UPI00095A7AD2|nr:hypothetical protein [[Limnothrix rosea] IAM M-220]OKH18789.1 hypothetical protein NIES208_04865 [[Limnothrix rosea] IAM M-220]